MLYYGNKLVLGAWMLINMFLESMNKQVPGIRVVEG